jgi:hypothetical protein
VCGWIIGAPEIPGAPDEKTVCVLTTFDPQVALRASKAYPATPRVTLGVDAGVQPVASSTPSYDVGHPGNRRATRASHWRTAVTPASVM